MGSTHCEIIQAYGAKDQFNFQENYLKHKKRMLIDNLKKNANTSLTCFPSSASTLSLSKQKNRTFAPGEINLQAFLAH